MGILKKTLKVSAITVGVMFGAFFVYANLEEPTLGEKIYMSDPTGIAMLEVNNNSTPEKVAAELKTVQGVTSHTYLPEKQTLVVTYSKKETDRQTILSALETGGIDAHEVKIESNRPQCPVHGYLDAFYRAKYALNIRK